MAIWHRESGSRAASRDGLGAVFQHYLGPSLLLHKGPHYQEQ